HGREKGGTDPDSDRRRQPERQNFRPKQALYSGKNQEDSDRLPVPYLRVRCMTPKQAVSDQTIKVFIPVKLGKKITGSTDENGGYNIKAEQPKDGPPIG